MPGTGITRKVEDGNGVKLSVADGVLDGESAIIVGAAIIGPYLRIGFALPHLRIEHHRIALRGRCTAMAEYENGLVAAHRLMVSIQEAGEVRLAPNPFVLQHRKVGCTEHLVERTLRKEDNSTLRLDDALVVRPKLVKRQDGIPRVGSCAIREVADDGIDAPVWQSLHTRETVLVVDDVEFHGAKIRTGARPLGTRPCERFERVVARKKI